MNRIQKTVGAAWRRKATVLRWGAGGLAILVLGIVVALNVADRNPPPGEKLPPVPIAEASPQVPVPPQLPLPVVVDRAEPTQTASTPPPDRREEQRQAALPIPAPAPEIAPPSLPGEPAWLRYAVAPPAIAGRAMVAVVIDDLGIDRKGSEAAIRLPGPVTLSFMTYSNDLPRYTAAARDGGHELLLHVPMEPLDPRFDPGPNGLLTGLSPEEILRRLRWGLDRTSGYVGINNHMGSKFTSSALAMAPVIEELRSRGLLFLDSRTAGSSVGEAVARQMGVPHAARDIFLDNESSAASITARLAELEQVARHRGSAIAIGHPHEATLATLSAWIATLADKPIVLVPVSAIVRQRGATGKAGIANWACIASLIETAKLNDRDPQAYLADTLVKLVNLWPASRLEEILPWASVSLPTA